MNVKKILSIETSCDETAAAVLEIHLEAKLPQIKTLSSVVRSQIALHKNMGGVVPETAARAHVKNIRPVVEKALTDADTPLDTIDYIAPTVGPGLIPSLIVGVEFAKTLALATGKKMIPVNHMLGHIYSPFGREFPISPPEDMRLPSSSRVEPDFLPGITISDPPRADNFQFQKNIFPQVALIVSGGHTILVLMENEKRYKVLGETVDDAAGEAFDKVAKLLGLPYPGGPEVAKHATKATAPVEFPRPMIHSKDYNFSFAGLKTAVLYYLRGITHHPSTLTPPAKANICAGFQNAAVDVLITKTMRAVKEFGAKSVSLSGGVSANKQLRESLIVNCKSLQIQCFIPPFNLCTDNAEMIGIAAAFMLHNGYKPLSYKTIKANPNLSL